MNKYILKSANGISYFAGYDPIYDDPVYGDISMAQIYNFNEVNKVKDKLKRVFNHETIIVKLNSQRSK